MCGCVRESDVRRPEEGTGIPGASELPDENSTLVSSHYNCLQQPNLDNGCLLVVE